MNSHLVLTDAHVHLHSHYLTKAALLSAVNNLKTQNATFLHNSTSWSALLLVSSLDGESPIESAVSFAAAAEGFNCVVCTESGSVLVSLDEHNVDVNIVFGNQLVTSEGLEILVYGADRSTDLKIPLSAAIAASISEKTLCILPWGFGKWTGPRAATLLAELQQNRTNSNRHDYLFVGDSGARLRASRKPTIIRDALELGFRDLPGSDPLPIKGDFRRIGLCGFRLHCAAKPDHDQPLKSLLSALQSNRTQPETFICGEALSSFVYKQFRMQIRKRLRNLA